MAMGCLASSVNHQLSLEEPLRVSTHSHLLVACTEGREMRGGVDGEQNLSLQVPPYLQDRR